MARFEHVRRVGGNRPVPFHRQPGARASQASARPASPTTGRSSRTHTSGFAGYLPQFVRQRPSDVIGTVPRWAGKSPFRFAVVGTSAAAPRPLLCSGNIFRPPATRAAASSESGEIGR